jgi:hypothetical protein
MRRIAAADFPAKPATSRFLWGLGIASICLSLLTLALLSPGPRDVAAGASCPYTIDFAGLPAGTILGEQYADFGVHISGVAANTDFPDALIVFDTNAEPTHDPDLAVDIGNIAIFAKNVTDEDPADGLVDDPDENDVGGTATFAFDTEVSIGAIVWVDHDHNTHNVVIAYDAQGDIIKSIDVPVGENASVQRVEVDAEGVRRLVFDYQESGGFTGIEVDCEQAATATPTEPPATATPTEPPATPTPTQAAATATPTPAETASPTPTAGTSTEAPPTEAPPTPTVAAAVSPPSADTSVSAGPGAQELPAGGGPPAGAKSAVRWAGALTVLALVLAGSIRSMRRTET